MTLTVQRTRPVRLLSAVTVTEPPSADWSHDPFVVAVERAADLVRSYGLPTVRHVGGGTFAVCGHGPRGAVRALVTADDPDNYFPEPDAPRCTCPVR